MNALIVDDDRFVVSALEQRVKWASLSIDKVFCANNIRQARAIIEEHSIHVMICDIEMPQGSGLELLAWIRETNRDIPTIFLTNYAQFHYAQKALELQSLDYFLKPISYEKLYPVLLRATERARRTLCADDAQTLSRECVWRSILFDPDPKEALARGRSRGFDVGDGFLLVSVEWFRSIRSREAAPVVDWGCDAYVRLMRALNGLDCSLLATEGNRYKIAQTLVLRAGDRCEYDAVRSALRAFLREAGEETGLDVSAAVCGRVCYDEVPNAFRRLCEMTRETILCRNRLLIMEEYRPWDGEYEAPDLHLAEGCLRALDLEGFISGIRRYLQRKEASLCANMLNMLYIDVFQLFLALLSEFNIEAHSLFSGEQHEELTRHRLDSLEDFIAHMEYLASAVISHVDFSTRPENVIEDLVRYIDRNIAHPLTRKTLAEHVYMNPDYLARVFKREKGVALGRYIKIRRIELAKKLMEETAMHTRDIAPLVGYASYSYFAVTFHEMVGVTAAAYREALNKASNR